MDASIECIACTVRDETFFRPAKQQRKGAIEHADSTANPSGMIEIVSTNIGGAAVTLAMDAPGHRMLVASDEATQTLPIPVAAYGPPTIDRPAITMRLGAPAPDVAIAEAGHHNGFGIASPCDDLAGEQIVHRSKPAMTGPSAVETIVPDRVGACAMRVYDFDVPALAVDVAVVVLP